MSLAAPLLEHPFVYRLWMAPFEAGKFAPVLAHNDLSRVHRVLDVGCGPGTNTARFAHADYLGIDINPRYTAWAARRHGRSFVAADVRGYLFPEGAGYDLALVNSFLHHVDDQEASQILAAVARAVGREGRVHVLDLLLPEEPSLARFLARHDRGRFARSLPAWRALFEAAFEVELLEPYDLGLPGLPMWRMVYCRGRPRAGMPGPAGR